ASWPTGSAQQIRATARGTAPEPVRSARKRGGGTSRARTAPPSIAAERPPPSRSRPRRAWSSPSPRRRSDTHDDSLARQMRREWFARGLLAAEATNRRRLLGRCRDPLGGELVFGRCRLESSPLITSHESQNTAVVRHRSRGDSLCRIQPATSGRQV